MMEDTIHTDCHEDDLFSRFQAWRRLNPSAEIDAFCLSENLSPVDVERLLQRIAEAKRAASGTPENAAGPGDSQLTESLTRESLERTRMVGRYRLLQEIGSGGMGTVWLAEQSEPVRRRVALKLIKSSLVSREEVARFEAERQALAMMDHPYIAKVFDGGTTDTGQPFFVMEFVAGKPIHEFCDEQRLSIRDRLQLFILVCRAVQHAHQKGIVHRDLKPSNILVTETEGTALPKVIDFGLAKAVDHTRRLTEKTLFTEAGKVVGTLQYMSPEQASLNSLDIDTRSDIYSLGIVLYELLTGSPPLDRDTLKHHAIMKILDMIRQQEPPRPSQRLSSSGERAADIGQQRRIDPKQLQSILRGELDWVVMKALEKDRKRRYETAASFADDIHRFLIDEPVIARPTSHSYRLTKLVRRNRAAVAVGLMLILSLVTGFIGTLVAWRQTLRTAQVAQEKQQQAVAFADELAQNQERANAAITLLHDGLQANLEGFHVETSPLVTPDPVVDQLPSRMDVLVRGRRSLANLYASLGFHFRQRHTEPKEWGKWFEMAAKLFSELDDEGALTSGGIVTYTTTLDNLAYAKSLENNNPAAYEIAQKIPQLWRRLYETASPTERNELLTREAQFYLNLGNYGDMHASLTRGIDLLLALPERDRQQELLLAKLLHNRTEVLDGLGRFEDAQLDGIRSIELLEKHGDYGTLLSMLNVLTIILEKHGKLEQRAVYLEKTKQVVEELQRINPDRTASVTEINILFNDAFHRHKQGEISQAAAGYTEVAAMLKNAMKSSPEVRRQRVYFQTFWHRADVLTSLARYDEAIPDYKEALSAVIASNNKEFDEYIPYLVVSLAELEAIKKPIAIAQQLDWIAAEQHGNADVLAKLAGIYAAAAKAETLEESRSRWLDRSFHFLQTLRDQGPLDDHVRQELDKSSDFDASRSDPRWQSIMQ